MGGNEWVPEGVCRVLGEIVLKEYISGLGVRLKRELI